VYIKDLTDVSDWYYLADQPGQYLAIGWLGSDVPSTGLSISDRAMELLQQLSVSNYIEDGELGNHTCEICGAAESHGCFYIQADGFRYLTPMMLTHYISVHGYSPPETFVSLIESQSSELIIGQIEEFEFPGESEGFREIEREFSPCGRIVMVVGVRPDDSYTYALYFWDLSESEYTGSGSWVPCAVGGLFSDIDAAIHEAKQTLTSRSDSGKI